ncbi:MAG: sensor histidine kinase [Candidatus Kapabacteria bacterium]|nr:sensor histidine kinase [Candidatus Kapabacteria bacterium]
MINIKIFRKLKIQGKLNFLFIVLTTIPVLVISSIVMQKLINNKREEALRNVKNEVISIKERTNLVLSRINRELIMLSKTKEVRHLIENYSSSQFELITEYNPAQNEIIELFKDGLYFKIEFINSSGRKFSSIFFDSISTYITPKNKLSRKPILFYVDVISDMKKGDLKLSPSEIKMPETGKIVPSIDCIFPIYNDKGKPETIIIASIHAENFFKLFTISDRDTSIKVVMCNGEGFYLYHSLKKNNWNRLLASRQEENLQHDYGEEVADSILNGKSGRVMNNSQRIIEYTNIFEMGNSNANRYVVFTEIPTSIVFAPVNKLFITLIILLVLVLLTSIIIAYYASSMFTKPIAKLIQGTKIIREGNLDYKLDIQTSDEIQDLAQNFNELVVHWKVKRQLEEQQRMEEDLRERKKYLENIIANMGHELRTPMIGIMGFSKMIPRIDDLDELHDIGNAIYDSSKRLMDTLNLILDISKLESGEYEPEITQIDLNEIVFMAIQAFSDFANEKNLEITFSSIESEMLINADLKAVQSILNCIIDNAIKFTNQGAITIRLKHDNLDAIDSTIIEVEDTGIGIEEKYFETIFLAFRQGSEGLSRSHEGTGLGLTLAKKYVELLGGSINVNSKVGVGSVFSVLIPNN